jgi:hypothetical protein
MQPKTYTQLEGNFTQSLGLNAPTFSTNEAVSLLATTQFLYTAGIMIAVVAAGVMYMRAGLIRMQPDSERAVSKSNAEIKRVTLGLLGILSLFVILYTFNRDLLTGDVKLQELRTNTTPATAPISTSTSTSTTSPSTQIPGTYEAYVASHNAVVARLAPSNINTNYNNRPCTQAQLSERRPQCTSLAYLPEETIQMLLRINGSCNCTIVITGGTEPGHAVNGSHGINRRGVDLRLTGPRGDPNNPDKLYQYLKSVSTRLGPSSNCFERYRYSTFTFCDERPPNAQHFHVD